jgi:Trk K+ transport system NAD-binding subunit
LTFLFRPPLRNFSISVIYMIVVVVCATVSYMAVGWNFADAVYMVVLTIYTVGFDEVRPVDTQTLREITIATIVLGCTGMIFVSGALVQFITINQLQQVFGVKRMQTQIDRLKDHVIICGFGRIGRMLAQDLKAAGVRFVILERGQQRCDQAIAENHLLVQGDATDEASLKLAGIDRARALATVLPDDAANVFITLSARSLNRSIEIIARGEAPSTERKLRHAGADKVVLPAHIGAERIAEMILYPETSRYVPGSDAMRDFERTLHSLGLEMQVLVAAEDGPLVGRTLEEIERQAGRSFMIAQLNRRGGGSITNPPLSHRVETGDGLVVVARGD